MTKRKWSHSCPASSLPFSSSSSQCQSPGAQRDFQDPGFLSELPGTSQPLWWLFPPANHMIAVCDPNLSCKYLIPSHSYNAAMGRNAVIFTSISTKLRVGIINPEWSSLLHVHECSHTVGMRVWGLKLTSSIFLHCTNTLFSEAEPLLEPGAHWFWLI